MVDLHCHILPKVDDGPATLDETMKMARFYVEDGITHIVATPHCHRYVHLLRADVLPLVAQLNSELESATIPLTILPGSEIQVTDTTAYRREFEAGLYCHLGDGRSFHPSGVQLGTGTVSTGRGIVNRLDLPHGHDADPGPSRTARLWKEPALLQALVEAGAWVQVTVDSLLGNHGPDPKMSGEALLRAYPDAVLATDAHNIRRCSGLSSGYAWVREHLGQQRAENLRDRANKVPARFARAKPAYNKVKVRALKPSKDMAK